MCRLFGMLSASGTKASEYLVHSENSLLRQADADPKRLQDDGWGIGWYEDARAEVKKGDLGAFRPKERKAFLAAAQKATGSLVVGHLRKASNPMDLPKTKLHGPLNSQPFAHGSALFLHNGWIPFPQETRPFLGEYSEAPQGINDSEVFFYLLLHRIEKDRSVPRAYEASLVDLREVWQAQGRSDEGPYGGMNILFSRTPHELWAFCNFHGDHGKALGGGDRPYYEMCYRETGDTLLVASEPMDSPADSWLRLPAGGYLHAELKNGAVKVRKGTFQEPAWK